MKLIFFIFLLISECGYSQEKSDEVYSHKSEIIDQSPVTINDIVGQFSQGYWDEGHTWTIYANQTFAKNHYGDIPELNSKVDTGYWKLKRHSKLMLYSTSGKTIITIVKIGTWRFFIFSNERKRFNKELNTAFSNYRQLQAMPTPTDKNAAVFLIGHELSKKFASIRLAGGT